MQQYDHQIRVAYETVKKTCRDDHASKATARALHDFVVLSLRFLNRTCRKVKLKSKVPGKSYHAYARTKTEDSVSRPVNSSLFTPKGSTISRQLSAWKTGKLPKKSADSFLYTAALAPCLAMELFGRQNKKGPATYFECFIGHIFAGLFGTNPGKQVTLPVGQKTVRIPTDFLFDVADGSSVHLAVKMSTRERVVQAWAHQKLLESAFGEQAYKGLLVVFSETKLDSRSHEVIEICVPDQWLAYQAHLARMTRIYYFDMPDRYRRLTREFPREIDLRSIVEVLNKAERASVLDQRLP